MRIACWNSKGGSGKTTTAVCVAGELARRGGAVLVVDLDEQGSALRWGQRRDAGGVTVIGAREGFAAELDKLAASYGAVVMDTPGRETRSSLEALMVADIVLIPVSATAFDIDATADALETVKRAQTFRPELQALLVLNRMDMRTTDARGARELLAQTGLPVAAAKMASRHAFASVGKTGEAPTETDISTKAAQELAALVDELEALYAKSTTAHPAE